MIEWLWPAIFVLLPLPLLVRYLVPAARTQATALRAPFFREWQALTGERSHSRSRADFLTTLLVWLLWTLLLTAAARPLWIGDPVDLPESGRDLMLAVDISGSMNTEDMRVGNALARRIDAVKEVGGQFIRRRSGDRLGLILFGSNAYVQSPLSFDIATVEQFLREAQIGFAGKETAIGDAIGLAVKRLRERPAESRVLILLTDGQDTASTVDPQEAAELAADSGIRIYTIGIGADELQVPGLFGSSFGSRLINPSAELDETGLRRIAESTGGAYFRARDPQQLASIYTLLDQLEPVEQDAAVYRPRQSLSYVPLLIALLVSFLLAAQRIVWAGAGFSRATPKSSEGVST